MGCSASLHRHTNSGGRIPSAGRGNNSVEALPEGDSREARSAALAVAERTVFSNAGQKFHEKYVRATLVSYGASARVLVADHVETARRVAVKVISKDKKNPEKLHARVLLEIACMKHVEEHPNAVRLIEVFEDSRSYHIVMDYCSGGELFDHIIKGQGGFTERQAAQMVQGMLRFLAHCHAEGVAHLDVKPENIVFDSGGPDGVLKVVDFGSSDFCLPHEILNDAFGTVRYCSPEMANDKPGQKTDVWSVGVVSYLMLCGKLPFVKKHDVDTLSMLKRWPTVKFSGRKWNSISSAAKNCIKQLLHPDPSRRPTALEALQLPWLREQAPDTSLSNTTLQHLSTFANLSRIRRLLLGVLARNLTGQEANKLVAEFQFMDRDHNGRVDFQEMWNAMKSSMPSVVTGEEEMKRVFQALDVDSTGTVEVGEFLAAMIQAVPSQHRDRLAQHSFRLIARDGADHIRKEDLRHALQHSMSHLEQQAALTELDAEFNLMDSNKDGVISFEEFRAALVAVETQ